jgi:hypothetical protein
MAASTRVDALVERMQRLALENEPLLRTMIRETVLGPAAATRLGQWMCCAVVRQSLNERAAGLVKDRARARKSS